MNEDFDVTLVHKVVDRFPPKSVADFLSQQFFRNSEANYHYMDRSLFQQRLDTYYISDSSRMIEPDPGFTCLILMVFAMGSRFAAVEIPSTSKIGDAASKHGPGTAFYEQAKLLLPDVITQCSLESIQVCFLFGLFLLPSSTSDLAYVYQGTALKMAIANGMHQKAIDKALENRVVELRNRLWWSMFASER